MPDTNPPRSFKMSRAYEWVDRDEDVTGSFDAWAAGAHPNIVGVLRLETPETGFVGPTACGIYVDVDQARDLASLFERLAAEHEAASRAAGRS